MAALHGDEHRAGELELRGRAREVFEERGLAAPGTAGDDDGGALRAPAFGVRLTDELDLSPDVLDLSLASHEDGRFSSVYLIGEALQSFQIRALRVHRGVSFERVACRRLPCVPSWAATAAPPRSPGGERRPGALRGRRLLPLRGKRA